MRDRDQDVPEGRTSTFNGLEDALCTPSGDHEILRSLLRQGQERGRSTNRHTSQLIQGSHSATRIRASGHRAVRAWRVSAVAREVAAPAGAGGRRACARAQLPPTRCVPHVVRRSPGRCVACHQVPCRRFTGNLWCGVNVGVQSSRQGEKTTRRRLRGRSARPAVRAGSDAAFRSPNPPGALNPEPPGALLQLGNFLKDLICLYLDSVSLSCRMECT